MSAKVGYLYFNETNFKDPPVLIENEEYSHRKDFKEEDINLKITGQGIYTFQVGMRKNRQSKWFVTFSLYDDRFYLAERKEKAASELVKAMKEGSGALSGLIVPEVSDWFSGEYPSFFDTVVSGTERGLETLVNEAGKKKAKRPPRRAEEKKHSIYHKHRSSLS